MTNDDMRKLMETVNRGESVTLNEAGGIIDKTLAAFGNEKAKGRISAEKGRESVAQERAQIIDGWNEFKGAQDYDDRDADGFKDFLSYWNFNSSEISKIMGEPFDVDDSLDIAAKLQYRSGKGATGAERGGPFKQATPAGDDYESIINFYKKTLGGNPALLQMELSAIKKPTQLSDDPLAMLGYAFMKAGGKGK